MLRRLRRARFHTHPRPRATRLLPCFRLPAPGTQGNAFWLLVQLVEHILYPGTYSPNLVGCQASWRLVAASRMPRACGDARTATA
jgi:hypothetical protein